MVWVASLGMLLKHMLWRAVGVVNVFGMFFSLSELFLTACAVNRRGVVFGVVWLVGGVHVAMDVRGALVSGCAL